MSTVSNGPTIPSVTCADRRLGSPSDGRPLPMTSRRFIRTTGADRANWPPSASSMIRLMLRAHRPHFGRQPKHLYTWPVVVGSRTAVVTMVRTSRSVRTLQEQMIMKASPARRPYTGFQWAISCATGGRDVPRWPLSYPWGSLEHGRNRKKIGPLPPALPASTGQQSSSGAVPHCSGQLSLFACLR